MNKKTILRIKHGSHLYGTNTPTSDLDYKEVYVPSGRDILLQRAKGGTQSGPDKEAGAKNQAGDVDVQSFAVHKLFDMCSKGDIVGMELIFAPATAVEYAEGPWFDVIIERDIFLSNKVDGYVGYCRQQANKYGIRGSRVAAARAVVELLEPHYHTRPNEKLGVIADELASYTKDVEHTSWEMIKNGNQGTEILHFVCCNRKAPVTVAIKEAYHIYKRVLDEYGDRAKQAEANEGVDWKALSHAIRVGHQAIELLETGKMTFPRPDAPHLLEIKKGLIPYKQIADELDVLLEEVLAAKERSSLPEEPNTAAIEELLVDIYRKQVL
jgi:hypothetical protein